MTKIKDRDKTILRELARNVAEIAADPVQEENKALWKKVNSLERVRPMIVLYDWTGWPAWTTPRPALRSALDCENKEAREIERDLRNSIEHWQTRRDDQVWEPVYYSRISINTKWYGVEVEATGSGERLGAFAYNSTIADDDPPSRVGTPSVTVDRDETERRYESLCELFDGILRVEKLGRTECWTQPMDEFIMRRGVEQAFIDTIDRPEWLHSWLKALTDFDIGIYEEFERQGLFSLNNREDFLLTGGTGYTDELPAPGFDPGHVRRADLWGQASTQIFSEVSPRMHEEFALQYEKRVLNRFGLSYYGCCEPLHDKVDLILKHITNVRRISMSPWADVAKGAEALGKRAVFSYKPNPAILGMASWDIDDARKQLRDVFDKTRDCVIEVTMKDLHTVNGQPQRISEWVSMAKALAEEYW